MKKAIAVGIILLFVAMACSPVINARNNTIVTKPFSIPEKEKTVSITVLEYRADGTIEKTIAKISQEQLEKFREELNSAKDIDARLSIYKKYNLIPQDVTAEKLRLGMDEKARRFGPEIKMLQNYMAKLKSNTYLSEHFCMNSFCIVNSGWAFGVRFLGGISLITSILNAILYFSIQIFLPSIDLFQMNIGSFGDLYLDNGKLPNSQIGGFLFASFILGFVGYYVSLFSPTIFITFMSECIGYAIACFGFVGLPISY